ncbi:MAG TPA: (2Fe-2S)-binding protein [Mycobacterium sp.]|nr:(2Fe-2S)-binding protein [Mycobacterium sp.]
MFVCLCLAVTNQVVRNAVQNGARTSQQVATACGAGSDCGRCRRTLRAIIAAANAGEPHPDNHRSVNQFACTAIRPK